MFNYLFVLQRKQIILKNIFAVLAENSQFFMNTEINDGHSDTLYSSDSHSFHHGMRKRVRNENIVDACLLLLLLLPFMHAWSIRMYVFTMNPFSLFIFTEDEEAEGRRWYHVHPCFAGVVVVILMLFTVYHREQIAQFFGYAHAEYNEDVIIVTTINTTKAHRNLLNRLTSDQLIRRTYRRFSTR